MRSCAEDGADRLVTDRVGAMVGPGDLRFGVARGDARASGRAGSSRTGPGVLTVGRDRVDPSTPRALKQMPHPATPVATGGWWRDKHALGGEFDPGSGSTLAACLMHASRTGSPSGGSRGGRVRNTWGSCRAHGGSHRKRWVIPDTLAARVGVVRKGESRRTRHLRPISWLVG